jgi:DHA1 family multidrug/chloramphenicol efflux transport protein-like MFS transporter
MQLIVGRYRLYSIVMTGAFFILFGLAVILAGTNYINMIVIGILIYAFGMGIANGCIWRLIMTVKGHSHSMLAAMLGFLQTLSFAVGVTVLNEFISYYQFSFLSFTASIFIFGLIGFLLLIHYISAYKDYKWS